MKPDCPKIVSNSVGGQGDQLGVARVYEALHPQFALPGGLVSVFRPAIQPLVPLPSIAYPTAREVVPVPSCCILHAGTRSLAQQTAGRPLRMRPAPSSWASVHLARYGRACRPVSPGRASGTARLTWSSTELFHWPVQVLPE
jgi:hypothetical protein